MGKNIVVLGMSTLHIDRVSKEISPNHFIIDDNDNGKGEEYYSQLEPVSRMIRAKQGSLDKVVIFATPETKSPVVFEYDEISKSGESAVDFYLRRMDIDKNETDRYEIIDVDDNMTAKAIFNAVESIKVFWQENINNDPKLWIDTQGGFRNLNLVVNAIISLLKSDEIIPSGIYSIKYNSDRALPYPIMDQTKTYKIFDFVSGINEFIRYGRADQLVDYYKSIDDNRTPDIIQKMKKITDNIQMCNMGSFDRDLSDLNQALNTMNDLNQDDLLDIFIGQIRNDYGRLLGEHTGLDVVEWLYKKKFYQQAVTYIESKMPKEWIGSIITYAGSEPTLSNLKNQVNKSWESDQNYVVNQIVFECFWWRRIVITNENHQVTGTCIDGHNNLSNGRKHGYKFAIPDNSIPVKRNGNVIGTIDDVRILGNYDDTMNLLLLYKLLKNERNGFNHMASDETRADYTTLGNAIEKFIEVGRKVYEQLDIH